MLEVRIAKNFYKGKKLMPDSILGRKYKCIECLGREKLKLVYFVTYIKSNTCVKLIII